MAEQPFKVGRNAKELLRYTLRATRTVSDDISRSDARAVFQKAAALEDVKDIQRVCETAVHALDTRNREGFTKSTYRLYGEGIRLTARQILLDAHAANNVNFQTDYDKRVEKIGAVVDGCSLLLEYLTICTEEGIISAKKAGIWTKKVTDVKYPAMKWLTSERGRAEKLRAEAERKRLTEQAAALKAVLYPEP
nr:MAG: 23S rRNA-intervening sequence protein [Bacteriophage sp.]